VPDYLLDSCVLVRHLRRHQPTTDLVSTLVLEGKVSIATISRTEIIEGMREHEREATMRLLDSLPAYPLMFPLPIWLANTFAAIEPKESPWINRTPSSEPPPFFTAWCWSLTTRNISPCLNYSCMSRGPEIKLC
jgi:hypothetical protein